ncbi:MAG TPA: hypothetical protein VK652_09745 [Steroidobacteraceae bacterium]|nr:hypothetical protein [Steroidobacteraceae bacterium]
MRVHSFQFSTRLRAALLGAVGIIAAAAAHADAATDLAVPVIVSLPESTQQCSDVHKAGQVLNQPAAAKSWEPEWPNTGN